jgi:hypothetical protein
MKIKRFNESHFTDSEGNFVPSSPKEEGEITIQYLEEL